MEKHIENLATIKYCTEIIEQLLSDDSLENRWLWEVRLKIAEYVRSYLLLHDKDKKAEQHILSDEEKQEIFKNHPLLQPFDQASIGINKEQREAIQKEIYDKVHKMYLLQSDSDSEDFKKKKSFQD